MPIPEVNKKEGLSGIYKPLGQILVEKNFVTAEQLDEALKTHWKRDIVLGEVLKELGFVKDEDLVEALDTQKANLDVRSQGLGPSPRDRLWVNQ